MGEVSKDAAKCSVSGCPNTATKEVREYPEDATVIYHYCEQHNPIRTTDVGEAIKLATAQAEVHRLRKCLDVAQMEMVAVVKYADSLGPCEVRDRLLEIAKTRPAKAADRPEQQARLAAMGGQADA